MAGRTTFVVANRLSLLMRADVILVLDKGKLINTGTHQELVRLPGPYRETAALQLVEGAEGATAPSVASAKTVPDSGDGCFQVSGART